ncbi:uncharacterized protein LOC123009252 [Tribolium madens]|uniref:uncharacterized protein LOC123009252 n=1 Tax=Tribolium madens TaxID=41895 RepID=UPI001CF76149|nr:uncharacterized protein LOC123009252 [Tribolium madens]
MTVFLDIFTRTRTPEMLFLYPILFILPAMASARIDCSRESYDECIRIADPLVKQPHLIFPDNMNDIDIVCRTWNKFVDCLKYYTDNCFTEQQRRQFNKAVEDSIESVHQMCVQPSYQKEYLQYAPCIKSTITEPVHCGSQYNLLVDQVAQGEIISKSTLCCSHDRFKQCILRETRRLCDRNAAEGPALKFATHIIDKALSFLQDQCYNYIPNSGDCTTLTTDSQPFSDPLSISTSSSEVYPWSTIQDIAPKEIPPSRVTPPKPSTTSTWLPSSSMTPNSEASPTQMLGSRTRPASFGRASSWSDTPTGMSTTPSSRPDWATVASWSPQSESDKTTTWYPAAGTELGNQVEEPNQQGLTKPRNGAATKGLGVAVALLAAIGLLG